MTTQSDGAARAQQRLVALRYAVARQSSDVALLDALTRLGGPTSDPLGSGWVIDLTGRPALRLMADVGTGLSSNVTDE